MLGEVTRRPSEMSPPREHGHEDPVLSAGLLLLGAGIALLVSSVAGMAVAMQLADDPEAVWLFTPFVRQRSPAALQ